MTTHAVMGETRGGDFARYRSRSVWAVAIGVAMAASLAVGIPSGASAPTAPGAGKGTAIFQHVGTFDVMAGNGSAIAEIVDVTTNGKQLVYADGEQGEIGFVDISDPAEPQGQGTVAVIGEPTSVAMLDPLVLVGINTSASFTEPSGELVVVHRNSHQIVASHELGGQPDAIAIAPDRKRAAIVIENERDEDLDNGLLPQPPTGGLVTVDLRGAAKKWAIDEADLSPVAANAAFGEDLEPEFVDINERNQAVVSFQENNHLAIVDLISGETVNEFPAGAVELNNIDTVRNGLIELDSTATKRREPDSVVWIDDDRFATANEGDYEDDRGPSVGLPDAEPQGGSRGFTVWNRDGDVLFEAAESYEHWLVSAGHYPELRSHAKGTEPEGVDVGTFGGRRLLFVGAERGNAVGVYETGAGAPEPLQVLPTGIRPEGLKAIPSRGLLAVSTERAEAGDGIPTMINLYRAGSGPAAYPMLRSGEDADGLPIPWAGLSGLVGDPDDADTIYAVSDKFLAAGFIYTIDVSAAPATIVDRLRVTGSGELLDLEGVAIGPDGHFWLASEGDVSTRPNLILKVDHDNGEVLFDAGLPPELEAMARGQGFEGIAVTGETGAEVLHVAIQRAWPGTGDVDRETTKIGRYEVASGEWSFAHYPLEPEGSGGWIGLSELTLLPDGGFAVIERDKGWGATTAPNAELKAVFGVDLADAEFRALDDPNGLVGLEKRLLRDLLPEIEADSIFTAEKLEGLAVAADGRTYAITDNDGLDGATGETVFLRLGDWAEALGG